MHTNRSRRRIPALLRGLTLAALLLLVALPVGNVGAASDNAQGAISVLVKSKVPLTPDVVAMISSHAAQVSYVWPEIDAMALKVTPSQMGDLVMDPVVAVVEPNLQGQAISDDSALPEELISPPSTIVPIFTSSDPIETWNLSMAETNGTAYDGTGVTVAVVDSGLPQNWGDFLPPGSVDTTHAAGFGAEGWGDFHNPVNAVRGVGGHIGLFPHGLAVSSVIVGFPSDFGPVGGAAPGATILPIRVLNQFNSGWFSWFTAAFLHVANLKANGDLTGPVVINFSIQARGNSQVLTDAIDYAISQDIVFVTIAGNFGPSSDTISFPGRLPQSITAGATGWTQEGSSAAWFCDPVPPDDPTQVYVATFSGREASPPLSLSLIDVLAPGSFVYGEWLGGPGFSEGRQVAFDDISNFIFGTSFASPHVAGIAAQMLEKNPNLTQAQTESILRSTALAIPPSPGVTFTPLSFVAPWGANATGSGLARGSAAVAATPTP